MMIKLLKYDVTFALTNRRLNEEVIFQKGFGTITGPNESGKSFLLEMIRWLLFGTAALRGEVSTYKKMAGMLEFVVKGETYVVTRTINSANLSLGNKPIAVGTKPVNTKLASILGFGLDVFDIACVANQDKVNQLGDMKPTERKRMVDSVIGLSVIDSLAKLAHDEQTQASKIAEIIKENLHEPIRPIQPDDYEDSELLAVDVGAYHQLVAQYNDLQRRLNEKRERPVCPVPSVFEDLYSLHQQLNEQLVIKTKIDQLKTMVDAEPFTTIDELHHLQIQLSEYTEYKNAQQWLALHRPPQYSEAELDQIEATNEQAALFRKQQHLTTQINDLKQKGTHTCPECQHTWFVSQDEIDSLVSQREYVEPVMPIAVDVELERNKLGAFATYWNDYETYSRIKKIDDPGVTQSFIDKEMERHANISLINDLRSLQKQIDPDIDRKYQERVSYEAQLIKYQQAVDLYYEWVHDQELSYELMEEIMSKLGDLNGVQDRYHEAVLYESQYAAYTAQVSQYDNRMKEVKEKLDEADEWKKAKTGLLDFRTKVKQHLIPSLNVVASSLLRQMTGGQRQTVLVDDDFEVTIDGQALHTLSGSAKVVANLALRLGLGRVLTNGVLSIFIGDEIDGSMDTNRVENTAQTFKNLCSQVSQILLITHKYPEADYYITLGNSNENKS